MLKPLTKEAIGSEFARELSVQDYSKKTTICLSLDSTNMTIQLNVKREFGEIYH